MQKTISLWFYLAGLMLLSSAAMASEVTISNTFTSGTPARAEEVNQNFSDVKTAVDDNHNRLTANVTATASNATEISNNAAAISGNTDGIASNAATISSLNSAINTNTANIENLSSSVSANTTDIGNIGASVSTNTADIDALNASVTANTDAVGINATAIDSNTARITANETAVASINQAVSIHDGNDTRLGRYLGVTQRINDPYSKLVYQGTAVWLLSDTGYLFALERWYSPVTPYLRGIDYFQVPTTAGDFVISTAKIYYSSTDCTGQEYLSANQIDAIAYTGFSPVISVRGGIVFRTLHMSGTPVVNYLPKGTGAIPIAYASSRDMDSTTCTQSPSTLLESALAISPNDPSITGVGNHVDYVWPLKFGF